MALRELPNNKEAEMSVLGSCFLSTAAATLAIENLTESSFFDLRNAKIFKAFQNLHEEKIPLDLTTVTTELTKMNALTEAGGVSYLTEIVEFVPTASNIDYYIQEVSEIKDEIVKTN